MPLTRSPFFSKKGKKLCLYTVQFFPYSLLHNPTQVGRWSHESRVNSSISGLSWPLYTPCKFILRKHFCGTIVYLISVLNGNIRVKLISVIAGFHICFLDTCSSFSLIYHCCTTNDNYNIFIWLAPPSVFFVLLAGSRWFYVSQIASAL
jgi:hypothetical protein